MSKNENTLKIDMVPAVRCAKPGDAASAPANVRVYTVAAGSRPEA